jgi:hypothetical protein
LLPQVILQWVLTLLLLVVLLRWTQLWRVWTQLWPVVLLQWTQLWQAECLTLQWLAVRWVETL